ncbi:MAG TPA: ABC transporter substrate-binding protein [Methylophilaceae bacterium]|nr:ABC transporter substrate-binding protein [Methylophilaceae bacterium]
MIILLSACKQSATERAINFAIAQAPINLDPRYATDAASERVNRLLYQRLVEFDEHSRPLSGLATWKSKGQNHYLFELKNNISSFHHGKKLTAADVKATYDSLISDASSPHAAEYANINTIEVVDEKRLEFTLNEPDQHFPARLIIGILPKDLIDQQHDFSHQPIGSGPLKFEMWKNTLQLRRVNDEQLISLIEVKDPTVRALKLVRGETDIVQGDLPPEMLDYLRKKQNIQIKTEHGVNYSYLGLNMQDPLLRLLKVRQAIAYGIDRQAIIDKVMVDHTRLATAILPPEHYAGNPNLTDYTYEPQLARQLLREAAVEMPLNLVYKTSTDPQRVRLATILQAQLAKIGIKIEIRSLDWGTFFDEVKNGQFQIYGLTWVGIKTPEIYAKTFGSENTPPKGFNRGRYVDEELDLMLAKQDWSSATLRIHNQLPYIPLWYEGQVVVMHKEIQGYSPKPDGNWDDLASVTKVPLMTENAH